MSSVGEGSNGPGGAGDGRAAAGDGRAAAGDGPTEDASDGGAAAAGVRLAEVSSIANGVASGAVEEATAS